MARPMVVMQTRDPHAYIYRAFDMMLRGALQGWQQYDNKQRAQASAGLQATKMAMDAERAGGVDGLRNLYSDPGFQEFLQYNDIASLPDDLSMAVNHIAATEAAKGQQAGVQPVGQQGVTVAGDQLQGRQQAAAAIAGVPAPPPIAAAPEQVAAPAPHMLAGATRLPEDIPSAPAQPTGPPAPFVTGRPRPPLPPGEGAQDWQTAPEVLVGELGPITPTAEGAPTPPVAEAPPEPANRTEKIEQILADRPEGFTKKQFKNMGRYLKTHKDLDKLQAKADKIKADTGAKYDPNKPKGKRWTGTGLTKKKKTILERARRIDAYIEKAQPAKVVTMGQVEAEKDEAAVAAVGPKTVARTPDEIRQDALGSVRARGLVAAQMPVAGATPTTAPTTGEPPPYSVPGLPQVPRLPKPDLEDPEKIYEEHMAMGNKRWASAYKRSAELRNEEKMKRYEEESAAAYQQFGGEVEVAKLAAAAGQKFKAPEYIKIDPLVTSSRSQWEGISESEQAEVSRVLGPGGMKMAAENVPKYFDNRRRKLMIDQKRKDRQARKRNAATRAAAYAPMLDRFYKYGKKGSADALMQAIHGELGLDMDSADLTAGQFLERQDAAKTYDRLSKRQSGLRSDFDDLKAEDKLLRRTLGTEMFTPDRAERHEDVLREMKTTKAALAKNARKLGKLETWLSPEFLESYQEDIEGAGVEPTPTGRATAAPAPAATAPPPGAPADQPTEQELTGGQQGKLTWIRRMQGMGKGAQAKAQLAQMRKTGAAPAGW